MPTNELKPCPFCGGKAKVCHIADIWHEVICMNCYAGSYGSENEREAIESWNRRSNDAD